MNNDELFGIGRTWIGFYLLTIAATFLAYEKVLTGNEFMLFVGGAFAAAAGIKGYQQVVQIKSNAQSQSPPGP